MDLVPFSSKRLPPHYYVQYVEQSNAHAFEKANVIRDMLSILWKMYHPNDGELFIS